MDSHGPAWVFIILSILCRKRVWIEVELLLQNRPPLFLWSLIWTGWKPRFYRFFEDFKERKWSLIVVAVSPPRFSSLKIIKKRVLIVVAVSTAPFSFVENGWRRTEDAYSRDFLRIPKQEKWVDFCLQYRQRHYMLLKMPLYLDLDVFHMRDHKDRGGPEAGNLQQQFKNSENFAFIFQIRKQQETRKIWIFPSIWSSLWFYVAVLQWKT